MLCSVVLRAWEGAQGLPSHTSRTEPSDALPGTSKVVKCTARAYARAFGAVKEVASKQYAAQREGGVWCASYCLSK